MTQPTSPSYPASSFWLQWVFANAWSELVGLGGTAAVALLLHRQWAEATTLLPVVLTALCILGAGTLLEGGLVGLAQWKVLQYRLPLLPALPWVRATMTGAAVAWALGLIPSTAAQLARNGMEPPPGAHGGGIFVLALGMGFLLGPVLAIPQAFVLRRYVSGAGWWIPANALAWGLGMVAVFAGGSSIPPGIGFWALAAWIGGSCLLAGLIVGGVHGGVLVWLLQRDGSRPPVYGAAAGQQE